MFKSRFGIFNKNSEQRSLSDMDPVFQKAISQLPKETQIDYCQRLINRAKFDLGHTECKKSTSELQALIKATERELDKIVY